MTEPSEEGVLDESVELEGRVVTLDLAFLFNVLLRDGNEINMKVVRGIPDGSQTIAAGIFDGALVVVFDRDVPNEVWFEDRSKKVVLNNEGLN